MKIKAITLCTLFCLISIAGFSQHENYWQQRVEYKMDIDMDVENHQFTGTQELTYHNNSPDTLERVFYHLYFNAFQPNSMMDVRSRTIEDPDSRVRDRIQKLPDDEIGYHHINSLQQNGQSVEYNVEGTILEVTLDEPIQPGESAVFNMEFESQVPRQIRRTGWMNKEGVEFSMSQWYPKLSEYDEDGWHPNPYIGREFHGVWGDFDVKISIDSSYVIGSTGHLQNPEEIGHGYAEDYQRPQSNKITWHWKAENVHDFFWGADPDFTHTTKQVPGGPTLHFFYQTDPVAENADSNAQRQLLQNWKQLPEYVSQAFQYVSENYGGYPYDKYSFVQGGDGGMEYPMGTLITGNRSLRSLVGVSVHELLHAWYQGVLATNESRYPWMDEGFTSYVSSKTMNHLFNGGPNGNPHQGSYHSYFRIIDNGMEEPLTTHADHYETNRAYGVGSYSKGAVFLHQLGYIIGEETLNSTMKRYFHEWKFKHPDGRDFLRVAEKESDMILDWYYEYFIETTKTIDYGITSVLSDNKSTYVTLKREDLMPMPIDLMVTYEDGSEELFYIPMRIMQNNKPHELSDVPRTIKPDWPWVNPTYTLEINKPSSDIQSIEIDPSERLADIDRENNTINLNEYMNQFSTE